MKCTIEFVKRVVFKDMYGTVNKVYEIGDRCEAHDHADSLYFVTGMGGIWRDEAKRVDEEGG